MYIDISVEFAFDSCVEISKLSRNTTENDGTRSQNFPAIHRFSVKFRGGICRLKTFCMRIFARKTFLGFRCSSIRVKMRVLLTFRLEIEFKRVLRSAHANLRLILV